MSTDSFFDETSEQSEVKAEIVEKYFDAWARIIANTQNRQAGRFGDQKLAYIDLFAGPGRYKNGAVSTPLKVLQRAIENDLYRERLVTYFNDKDETNAGTLEKAIDALPGIEKLTHKPSVMNEQVGSEIAAQFEKMSIVPTLAFIDPWGYKGLSLRLVNAFLKDWGCDCIFFFNYNRD
jgi:three-Cys-motif partner protein